jgi:DNA modification methylase
MRGGENDVDRSGSSPASVVSVMRVARLASCSSEPGDTGNGAPSARLEVVAPANLPSVAPVLSSTDGQIADALLTIDWDFTDADTGHSGHALQPYPAKFPPQLPEFLIRLLSCPGDLVLDCFGGCGTTALEAVRLGRHACSIDANPVATYLTQIKTTPWEGSHRRSLNRFLDRLRSLHPDELRSEGTRCWRPEIPNVARWYSASVIDELAALRSLVIRHVCDEAVRRLCLVAFAYTASRMSFQDSETRYKSVPRAVEAGEPLNRFIAELVRMENLLYSRVPMSGYAEAITGDARSASVYPEPESVGLIVSSPPYPNAYDYHLYHRFRLFWLGEDPSDLRRLEIGSHLNNQSSNDPVFTYERDMALTLANAYRVLQPGRFLAFVVGDGLHDGAVYETSEAIRRLGALVGFEHFLDVDRRLPTFRRAVTAAGRRLCCETIVVLRKPGTCGRGERPPYGLFPYEESLARLEADVLASTCTDSPLRSPEQAAFWYVAPCGSGVVRTWQALSEYTSGGDARKNPRNPTYAGHGLHRYKGKFYPQLAKSLINLTDPYGRDGVVLDPFGGSGTVAVEARLAGLRSVSIDVNPLAVRIAQAKQDLLDLNVASLKVAIERVLAAACAQVTTVDWERFSPAAHEELASWFPERVLAKLSVLLSAIEGAASQSEAPRLVESVLRVVVSSFVREVSHQEPRDLRVRRRKDPLTDAPVFELFEERAKRLLERRRDIQHRLDLGPPLGSAVVVEGSAADPRTFTENVDRLGPVSCVVSSPPYGVALPYLDTDRLSLAAVYGMGREARAERERELIGSREITSHDQAAWEVSIREGTGVGLPARTVVFIKDLYEAVSSDDSCGFRRRQMPAILLRYFWSMAQVICLITERLLPGGEVALVLGDSKTTIGGVRWTIPIVDEVIAIAKECGGLSLIEEIPITVTKEALVNSRHSITENRIVRFVR